MATSFDSGLNLGASSSTTQAQGFSFRLFRHPAVAISHVAFRSSAILFYIFCGVFTSDFIVQFLILLTLLSMDFWTVKNVTGRLMDPTLYPALDRNFFWLALLAAPLVWGFFVTVDFMTFKWEWMIVSLLGFAMTGANLYGYLRCRWADTNQMTNAFSKWAFLNMLRRQATPPATQQPTQLNV
ncbi:unnamed protein product, partial [Mesorhabditis spiculigera]